MALTKPAGELGFHADADFPRVYGVLMDWDIGQAIATVMSMRDGTASLYTTSTFGIIGGHGHERVRHAAVHYVQLATEYLDASEVVTDFPYPKPGTVYYYLLTYDNVRRCVGNLSAIEGGSDPTRPLFAAAQNVLTELRSITEQ